MLSLPNSIFHFDIMNTAILFYIKLHRKKQQNKQKQTKKPRKIHLISRFHVYPQNLSEQNWGFEVKNISSWSYLVSLRLNFHIRNPDHLAARLSLIYIFFHNFTALYNLERTTQAD